MIHSTGLGITSVLEARLISLEKGEPPWEIRGRRIVVVGAARTGKAVARFLAIRGARVTLVEQAPEREFPGLSREMGPLGVTVEFGPHHDMQFLHADGIVLSPGVSPALEPILKAKRQGIHVVSELELASWFQQGPMIAVTGTNGKTTTTSLIGDILRAWGRRTFIGGNIGNPLVNAMDVDPPPEMIVIEVSSFQLECTDLFRPDVAALLNLSEDHLDRHPTAEIYRDAKGRIFHRQREGDLAVVNVDDPEVIRALPIDPQMTVWGFSLREDSEAEAVWVEDEVRFQVRDRSWRLPIKTPCLRGSQNGRNIMAACLCALAVGCPPEVMDKALERFSGLAHRFEFVGEVKGVRFINDSKATNVGAVLSALESCSSPVVLVAGGRDKGIDFTPLREAVGRKVKSAVLLGEAGERLGGSLRDLVPIEYVRNMKEAVQKSIEAAVPGDVVLLSPACSSFDMYTDYEERGEDFKSAVNQFASASGAA